MRSNRYRLKPHEIAALDKMRNKEVRNILVIGDLHEPFCLDGYLDWCIEQYENYNCNHVIYIGDCIDSHGFSYHEPDPDGMSAGNELKLAIKKYKNGIMLFLMQMYVLETMIEWLQEKL